MLRTTGYQGLQKEQELWKASVVAKRNVIEAKQRKDYGNTPGSNPGLPHKCIKNQKDEHVMLRQDTQDIQKYAKNRCFLSTFLKIPQLVMVWDGYMVLRTSKACPAGLPSQAVSSYLHYWLRGVEKNIFLLLQVVLGITTFIFFFFVIAKNFGKSP